VAVIDIDRTGTDVLRPLKGASVVIHNAAFDLGFFEEHVKDTVDGTSNVASGGSWLFSKVHDTLQAARLTLGIQHTKLKDAVKYYLKLELDKDEQTSDWSAESLSESQLNYAAIDVVVLKELAQRIVPALDTQRSAYDIQIGAVPAAVRMTRRGFKMDKAQHARLMEELKSEQDGALAEYAKACLAMGLPEEFHQAPRKPKDKEALLEKILNDKELQSWLRTPKTDALSTSKGELRQANHYPPIEALATWMKIEKLLTSFGSKYPNSVSSTTGRIHAAYNVEGRYGSGFLLKS
jgi:DNA polymerase I-like protein with 3'-5' exonuclease and polymerase domains